MRKTLMLGMFFGAGGCGAQTEGRTDSGSFTTVTTVATDGGSGDSGTGASEVGSATAAESSEATSAATTATSATDSAADGSTGEEPMHFMLTDPLIGGTMGTGVGGSFGDTGWTVTTVTDRVYWSVPRLVEGSVEFTISNVTLGNLPLNDHEVFAMYDGGYGIEHPIGYNPEFRNNAFKSMIRIYGTAEVGREGLQKLMWGICPFGTPGYHDGNCPCTNPVGFFEEPFGGDGAWDGSPQVLRVEWADGVTRLYRNGGEVLGIDWTATGFTFGPQSLYVSLGNPRPEEVGTAGMPIGAVFSNVVIEGWTGPETAVCG